MNGCPLHGVRNGIRLLGGYFSEQVLRANTVYDIQNSTIAYTQLGELISEIFPASFFEKEIPHTEFYGIYPISSRIVFQQHGTKQIRRFFSHERQNGMIHPKKPGMKIQSNSLEEVIIQGWNHACYLMTLFLNEALRRERTDTEYEEFLNEIQKILMLLGKQHLVIESGFVLDIDRILRGDINIDTIDEGIDRLGPTHLPTLGCPALFFGDKRAGRAMYEWISHIMLEAYKSKSSTRILLEKIHRGFSEVFR